jgi:trk system potassium uptake protein TrkA
MYAKSIGVKRSIALVNKNDFLKMASRLNIDTTISMNNAVVNSILKLVRKGKVQSIHAISGGNLEVIELSVEENSRVAEKMIKDIKLPYHTLILFISRGDENYLPHGGDVLYPNDRIVLITRKENLPRLDQLFAKAQKKQK